MFSLTIPLRHGTDSRVVTFYDKVAVFKCISIAPNGELLRDLWPGGLGRAGTDHNSVDSLESWQLMPVAFEDLCDWAKPKIDLDAPKIISGGGKRTPYALLWSPHLFQDDRADEMHRVSFRVHGFISNFDIRPLGNWNK